MAKDVSEYVSRCEVCKTSKATNKIIRPPMGSTDFAIRPWQRIYIDFIGPYPRSSSGKTFIFIILDQLTKFVVLKALPKATAGNIIKVLREEIFNVFGVPEKIKSDNGSQFVSKEFGEFLNEYGIKPERTAFYSPQSNASERVNRSIICSIRGYMTEKNHKNWDIHLSDIASALRNAVHQSTSYSPHFLMFGYHKINHADSYKILKDIKCLHDCEVETFPLHLRMPVVYSKVLEHLRNAFEKNERSYNLRSRPITFQTNDVVYVRQHNLSDASKQCSGKLFPKWKKAVVHSRQGNVNYVLKDDNGKILGTYHAKDIKS